ncbi:plastid transcriptionally active 5 [Quillaja saponaria]|uniref:Plastid transcriptionally active 5 n=1 Tax=Quillaja saponaria TaxID=32244 RepID=A0AAD7PHZ6_QUISA|nr:plastid transcriptionally active 5 [Quillaja saponaria]
MSSSLPLSLNLHLSHKPGSPIRNLTHISTISKPFSHQFRLKSFICYSSNTSDSDREEIRWLREEQRWLREEQRWLREEQRWIRERDSLLRGISDLKLQIQALEHRISSQGVSSSSAVSDAVANVTTLLEILKEKNTLIAEKEKKVVQRNVLRKGSEGAEVQAMQEALLKLGFYSGEEDMEHSSFSSGTELAVKTWQATLGALEDGKMTAELLEKLFMELRINDTGNADQKESSLTGLPKEGVNGAAVPTVPEISEVKQKVAEEGSITKVEVSVHRVFLLGENRWEDPSRLVDRGKQVDGSKVKTATTKCLTCRGEGRLLCTECDGTGEPNIEQQFLEWVDEDMKCPYCEGLGYNICDTCEGKTVT